MNRRKFLVRAAALPILPFACSQILQTTAEGAETASPGAFKRVRPDNPLWPSNKEWDSLGHEPDLAAARRHALQINDSMTALLAAAREAGSYVSESDYFESRWQQSHWGSNYTRLSAVKKKYDPAGLFFVHHGVGSEEWSPDGFARLAGA